MCQHCKNTLSTYLVQVGDNTYARNFRAHRKYGWGDELGPWCAGSLNPIDYVHGEWIG